MFVSQTQTIINQKDCDTNTNTNGNTKDVVASDHKQTK